MAGREKSSLRSGGTKRMQEETLNWENGGSHQKLSSSPRDSTTQSLPNPSQTTNENGLGFKEQRREEGLDRTMSWQFEGAGKKEQQAQERVSGMELEADRLDGRRMKLFSNDTNGGSPEEGLSEYRSRSDSRDTNGKDDGDVADSMSDDSGPSRVPHLMQEETWDCGLASLKMVLRAARPGIDSALLSNDALLGLIRTKSIWTIDLAYVLAHFGVPFVFYTISTNVNKSVYRGIPFYDEIDNDEDRVNRNFEQAKAHGVQVVNRSITEAEVKSILLGETPMLCKECQLEQRKPCEHITEAKPNIVRCAIVLVDITIMRPYARERPKNGSRTYGSWLLHALQENIKSTLSATARSSYSGHYIVLIGYDKSSEEYAYRDPASALFSCYIDASVLEKARKAVGTDEDILFVELDGSQPSCAM